MPTNLIELFKNSISHDLVTQVSGQLGESAQSITTSLESIVPSLLGAVISKANSSQGVKGLLEFISTHHLEELPVSIAGTIDGQAVSESSMTLGSDVMKYLFGSQETAMIDLISANGGLKTSSASSILRIMAPLFLGYFGRFVKERNLNTSAINELLESQKAYVMQSAPHGLNDLLGLKAQEDNTTVSGTMATSAQSNTAGGRNGLSLYLPWLVLLLTALGLFYFLEKGCHTSVSVEPKTTIDSTQTNNKSKASTNERADQDLNSASAKDPNGEQSYTMPNGTYLNSMPNAFTASMITYLNSSEPAGKCIPFDAVFFEPGTTKFTPMSVKQLYQLQIILTAYPAVNILINGSSKTKASAVMDYLINIEVAQTRLQAKGGSANDDHIDICVVKR